MPGYVDKYGDAVRGVIRAYHGSPHNFNRFDASRIGTGEGAQTYGHGLYFAGNEDVAKFYRNNIRSGTPEEQDFIRRLTAEQARLFRRKDDLIAALDEHARKYGSPSEGWGDLHDIPDTAEAKAIQNSLQYLQTDIDDATQSLSAAWSEIEARPGHMYEVDISVNPDSLLDWDAPLSAQPQPFRDVLQGLNAVPELPSSIPWEPVGAQAYKSLVSKLGGRADDVLERSAGQAGVAAAKRLLDAGVPGIRYLDSGSRAAKGGTRNYVMFPGTEDSIAILRKYGLLPATLGAEGLVNQQPGESTAPAF